MYIYTYICIYLCIHTYIYIVYIWTENTIWVKKGQNLYIAYITDT